MKRESGDLRGEIGGGSRDPGLMLISVDAW